MTEDFYPVILTYHSIAAGDSPIRVPPELFAVQMEWLAAHATVVPLGSIVRAVVSGGAFPERAVALTFDDGFRDFAEQAAPVLRKFKLPATVFLPSGFCGGANDWPGQPDWVEPQPLLDWTQICDLAVQGFSFGAHTRSHCVLTEVGAEKAEQEIELSRRDIEQNAHTTVRHFCYPYGLWNAAVRDCVSRHFEGACSTAAGMVAAGADPYALPRVDAHYLRTPAIFRSMFTRRFRAYVTGRRWIRRLRGKPEGKYVQV